MLLLWNILQSAVLMRNFVVEYCKKCYRMHFGNVPTGGFGGQNEARAGVEKCTAENGGCGRRWAAKERARRVRPRVTIAEVHKARRWCGGGRCGSSDVRTRAGCVGAARLLLYYYMYSIYTASRPSAARIRARRWAPRAIICTRGYRSGRAQEQSAQKVRRLSLIFYFASAALRASTRSVFSHETPRSSLPICP